MPDYALLERQVELLLEGETDTLANAANFAAFVFYELDDINWAGFYYAQPGGELVLGPFNGRPACTRLAAGRGVCGAAFTSGQTLVVDDVHAFADHIACDSASQSEIVVPLVVDGRTIGVFDIDSPRIARFSDEDRRGLERLVGVFSSTLRARADARPRVPS
jgi:GAF domain-containing protein